jgi:hypothetical protein
MHMTSEPRSPRAKPLVRAPLARMQAAVLAAMRRQAAIDERELRALVRETNPRSKP